MYFAIATRLEVLVELLEDEAHARHQAARIRHLAMLVSAPLAQRRLVRFKVLHPLDGEIVRLNVNLVEDEDEWQAGLVKDSAVSKAAQATLRAHEQA